MVSVLLPVPEPVGEVPPEIIPRVGEEQPEPVNVDCANSPNSFVSPFVCIVI